MSEEMKKKSAFSIFAQTQQTFAEAEEKAKQEAGSPKVERFRISENGDYSVRVLPIAPVLDAEGNVLPMDRKGYEYPLHQLFLAINLPGKKGKKAKKINIPVVRATDKGVDKSIDLIDTYIKIAKELYGDDADLIEKITSNSYSGGLRWSYQHAIMVLDVSSDKERAKGPQLWQCSHSQYKDMDDAKMRLWSKEKDKNGRDTCPISGLTDAYPVNIIRKEENKKVSYTFEIDRDTLDLNEEEVTKLLDLPRIPELIYRFTRYQLEAEVVFLQQYDEQYDMEVCKEPDFLEAVEKLKGEMPADDQSHFDLASAGKDGDGKGGSAEVTIDSLWDEYDQITDAGLSDKSDEYQELREKIRQFAEDHDLDVRLSRSKNNKQLLEEVEDAWDDAKSQGTTKKEETKPAPKAKEEPEETDDNDNDNDDKEEKKEAEAPAEEAPARRRRPRPTAEPAEEATTTEEPEDAGEGNDNEERPLHRRRRRG